MDADRVSLAWPLRHLLLLAAMAILSMRIAVVAIFAFFLFANLACSGVNQRGGRSALCCVNRNALMTCHFRRSSGQTDGELGISARCSLNTVVAGDLEKTNCSAWRTLSKLNENHSLCELLLVAYAFRCAAQADAVLRLPAV
jgi:hypothetical protein